MVEHKGDMNEPPRDWSALFRGHQIPRKSVFTFPVDVSHEKYSLCFRFGQNFSSESVFNQHVENLEQ